MANINIQVRNLLINHLGFTEELLSGSEKIIRLGNDKMKEEFFMLIISVKEKVDLNEIENPALYFIGALKNQLIHKGLYNGK